MLSLTFLWLFLPAPRSLFSSRLVIENGQLSTLRHVLRGNKRRSNVLLSNLLQVIVTTAVQCLRVACI